MKSRDQKYLEEAYESVLNGLAKGKTLQDIADIHNSDIDELHMELVKGMRVEKEHTNDEAVAKEIAMDHLYEDPKYYTKLAAAEDSKLS
jgi:hypothetical protein